MPNVHGLGGCSAPASLAVCQLHMGLLYGRSGHWSGIPGSRWPMIRIYTCPVDTQRCCCCFFFGQKSGPFCIEQPLHSYKSRREQLFYHGGSNNQSAPQPHHTNFQFNPTYFRSNFCGQNEPHRETPQRAQQQSQEEDGKDQGAEYTWSSWLWGARKSRRAEPQPTGTPPPQGYNTNTTRPLFFGEKFSGATGVVAGAWCGGGGGSILSGVSVAAGDVVSCGTGNQISLNLRVLTWLRPPLVTLSLRC